MKEHKLFIDNVFRNPLHWNRCHIENIDKQRVYGIYIRYGEKTPTRLLDRWILVIYFYKWHKGWSNYPLN